MQYVKYSRLLGASSIKWNLGLNCQSCSLTIQYAELGMESIRAKRLAHHYYEKAKNCHMWQISCFSHHRLLRADQVGRFLLPVPSESCWLFKYSTEYASGKS